MRQVIVFPRGQLTPEDRRAIVKAGAVAVEADDPAAVVSVLPLASSVSSDDLFQSMLEALANYGGDKARGDVITKLAARVKTKAAKKS